MEESSMTRKFRMSMAKTKLIAVQLEFEDVLDELSEMRSTFKTVAAMRLTSNDRIACRLPT